MSDKRGWNRVWDLPVNLCIEIGGVQHSSFEISANAGNDIADWVAEDLGSSTV